VHPSTVSNRDVPAGTLHNFGTSTFWPRALVIYGWRDQPSTLNIDTYSFRSWVMTSAMEYFCKYMCNSCVRALSRNPIKVVNLPPPQMVGTLTLRCIKLPHYVNAREPGECCTISPICVWSEAPAKNRFPFLTFLCSFLRCYVIKVWKSHIQRLDSAWLWDWLVPSITPASQT